MRSNRKRWFGSIAGFVVGAAACGVGGWFFDAPWASFELESAVNAAKAAGVPWVESDLRPEEPLAGRDNALTEIQMSGDKLRAKHAPTSPTFLAGPTVDWAAVEAELTKKADILADLRKAAAKPGVDFRRDWDQGIALQLPEYIEIKQCTDLLCESALLLAKKKKFAESGHEIASARRLAAMTAQDPTAMASLVAASSEAVALATANQCMVEMAGSEEDLVAFGNTAIPSPLAVNLLRCFRGEAYSGIATIRNLAKLGGWKTLGSTGVPTTITDPVRTGTPTDVVERAFLFRHLQFWTTALTRLKENPEDPLKVARSLDRTARTMRRNKQFSYRLSDLTSPVFGSVTMAAMRARARWAVQTALQRALVFRARNHRFPSSLAELGEIPADPFGGKPLNYRVKGDSLRISSVGADGLDEGGLTAQEAWRQYRSVKPGQRYDDVVAAFPVPKENPAIF